MKFQAIIFDMDGTIVATEHLWKQASHAIITNRGYVLSATEEHILQEKLPGSGLRTSCQLIKDITKTDDSVEDLMKEKQEIVCQLYGSGVCFIDGFPEFYKKVTANNLKTAIATNANQQTIELTNKSLNLDHYFGNHIYTMKHVHNIAKPNPAVYLYAAHQLGISPAACIAIEDSAHGIAAAQAAGMFCIGINSSGRPEQISKADLKVETYHDIDLPLLLFACE